MKTLIEKSIIVHGIGRPDLKTIFNIENEEEKNDIHYQSISIASGRKIPVSFNYLENDLEKKDLIKVNIPFNLNEDEIKSFVLEEIGKALQ